MAIGVMPPSLKILRNIGLDRELIAHGVRVRLAVVHGGCGLLGRITFDHLPCDNPFILSVPQAETVRLLEGKLSKFPSVRLQRGTEVIGVTNEKHRVGVCLRDTVTGNESSVWARYLVACDGHKSSIRKLTGMVASEKDYGLSFLMADFDDHSGLASEAHLFFSACGSVESFPLPGGRRRWIAQTDRLAKEAPDGFLEQLVRERSGYDLTGSPKHFQSPFRMKRLLNHRFFDGRIVFCGDAAHVMSPIGGQGMNTGFADAEYLAGALAVVGRSGESADRVFAEYDRCRRRAFCVASARAARGMWLGTRTGRLATRVRDAVLRHVLLRPPLNKILPAYYAMLTVPNYLSHVSGTPVNDSA